MPIDASDLRLLFERHSPSLLRFAGRRTADPDDAVAETFLRAFRSMPDVVLDDEGAQRAWLFRVLRNITISSARRQTVADRVLRQHGAGLRGAGLLADDDGPDLDDHLARLPERQRVVLELRFVHDLDVDATATVLGLTPEATRALTYRALTTLRRLIDDVATTPGLSTT